ncbi:MAG: bifunctional phosphoglucose/phosphomannose isomerase [Vulcanimicrobiota bacterium]
MAGTMTLDSQELISTYDLQGMLDKALSLPEQMEETPKCLEGFIPPGGEVKNVVILGMGGSRMGGDLIKAQYRQQMEIPLEVCPSYLIPHYVGRDSLVIAVSYSGNTEETLTTFEQARTAGARLICITSGGALKEQAGHYHIPCITIPGGLPPRSALGYIYTATSMALERSGILENQDLTRSETIALLKTLKSQWGALSPSENNAAKRCAAILHDKTVAIFASGDLTAAAAERWRCQLNENAKMVAYSNRFPEMNHNELVGWTQPGKTYDHFHVVILRDREDLARVEQRVDFTREVLEKRTQVSEFTAHGDSSMARLFFLVYLGDIMSVYCALLNSVNPTSIDIIDAMKEFLRKNRDESGLVK